MCGAAASTQLTNQIIRKFYSEERQHIRELNGRSLSAPRPKRTDRRMGGPAAPYVRGTLTPNWPVVK